MVVEVTHALYKKWHADSFNPQLLYYYDTSCKKLKHINGKAVEIDARTPLGFAQGFAELKEEVQLKLTLAGRVPPPL
jgi:hypothetical protein